MCRYVCFRRPPFNLLPNSRRSLPATHNAIDNTAIIVACLASFRTLFTGRDSSRIPKYTPPPGNGSSNLFLRRMGKVRPSDMSLLAVTGLSEVHAPSIQHSAYVQAGEQDGADPWSRFKGPGADIVPLQGVHVKREVDLSNELR